MLKRPSRIPVVVTGMGVRTAIGSSVPEFAAALREGRSGIAWIPANGARIAGAPLRDPEWGGFFDKLPRAFETARAVARRVLRTAPLATRIGCVVALEAIVAADLVASQDYSRAALLVAGNNIHQRYMQQHYERLRERPEYLNPRYAVSFLDTNVVGAISEIAGLRGPGFTLGGSMASGNAALYQAYHLLQSGAVDACVCVGALADYGDLELQAFTNLGALNRATPEDHPDGPAAPFSRGHAGFVYGQGSGCAILETADHAAARGAPILAELAGVSLTLDGHAASEPSPQGEAGAMRDALAHAGVEPASVDYLNAHGTGTEAGDEAECEAIEHVFAGLRGPYVNSTKALTGHPIYAAGIVELIATVLQMNGGFLHPNPGLTDPISKQLRFAGPVSVPFDPTISLSNSFSVGGINSSIVVRKFAPETPA
jgi:malonyl-ACP decarboxylase